MTKALPQEEGVGSPLGQWASAKSLKQAARLMGVWQLLMIILFARYGNIPAMDASSPGTITQGYQYFIGIEIMMFIGFGYLMTFMRTYGLGAVGFTMLVTAFGIQWYLFCEHFFHQIYHSSSNDAWSQMDISIYSLMNCLFGVSAVLISFGAVIGKIKPFQLVIMTIIELVFHALNYEWILIGGMKTADIGGTYADHMFGAYFGLAVSFMLKRSKKPVEPSMGYVADIFALIGTLFLWIYWPSFVGGGAAADSVQQQRSIINTILALSASTISTFYMSAFMTENYIFRPVDIQNATLAGGVAIGCVANFNLNPVNAIFIGCAAGLTSTYGYHVIQPYLFKTIGLHDTCGVHNLHGMPSIIGGIASIILAAYKQSGGRDHDGDVFLTDKGNQAWRQFVSILLVITCAVIPGLVTGWILNKVDPSTDIEEYSDKTYWETAEDFPQVSEGSETGSVHLEKESVHKEEEKKDVDIEMAGTRQAVHNT